MKYIFLAMTMFMAGASVVAENTDATDTVQNADNALNLDDGSSSNFYYGKYYGGYRIGMGSYPYSLSYPYNYGYSSYGCGANYYSGCGLSWGLYNPFYIYRSPPAVYPLDTLGLTPASVRFPYFGARTGYLGNLRGSQGDVNTQGNANQGQDMGDNNQGFGAQGQAGANTGDASGAANAGAGSSN